MLKFDGKGYPTISDVTARFPISAKKLKQMIEAGQLPKPEEIEHGTRRFTHYSAEWQAELAKKVKPRAGKGGSDG